MMFSLEQIRPILQAPFYGIVTFLGAIKRLSNVKDYIHLAGQCVNHLLLLNELCAQKRVISQHNSTLNLVKTVMSNTTNS